MGTCTKEVGENFVNERAAAPQTADRCNAVLHKFCRSADFASSAGSMVLFFKGLWELDDTQKVLK